MKWFFKFDKVTLRIIGRSLELDPVVGEGLRYQSLKLLSDFVNVCDHNLPTLQPEGQTTFPFSTAISA